MGDLYDWKPGDFETPWDDEHTFPFIEDEDAYGVYGYGHHDKAEFARLVNEYDLLAAGLDPEDCNYTASDVKHCYAAPSPRDPERFTWRKEDLPVMPTDPGAFPLTLITR